MQKPTLSLSGVIAPIPTPFNETGDIHLEALQENLQCWNRFDLRGYVVLGSNGEGVYLDEGEKVRVWEETRQVVPAEKLIIAGTGCESTRQTIALTRRAAEAGADAALVVTPHYYGPKMTADGLVQHYQAVADASPIPVLIYSVPKFTGVNMDAAAVARASEHPNIVGIKDTSGNITQLGDTVRQVAPGFQVLVGSAGFFLAGLVVGAVGGILALANIAPQQMLDLYRLCLDDQWEEAAELQRRMIPVNGAITARYGIAGLKTAMDMLGYYGGPVRSPLLQTAEGERQTLKEILVEGGILT